MPQEQMSFMKYSGVGVVAAFGLLTMSSTLPDISVTSMSIKPDYFYEASANVFGEGTVCNSSMLSEKAVGDIVSFDRVSEFMQIHDKINVNLQITRITKHVSCFDFEDEYEEI